MGWLTEGFKTWHKGIEDAADKKDAAMVRLARRGLIVDPNIFGQDDYPHVSLITCLRRAWQQRKSH